jgi:hypothetical protein
MVTALIIILFVAVTLGPLTMLWLRAEAEKRRRIGKQQRPRADRRA